MKPKLTKQQKKELFQAFDTGESIASLCRTYGISRVLFYRLQKRREEEKKERAAQQKKFSPRDRKAMLDRAIDGEKISRICKMYGISRTAYYKWEKRYQEALLHETPIDFSDKVRVIDRYYRQTPEKYEEAVLDAVRKYPELSSHRLPYVLPHIGNKPIVGNHGIQNILRRHNLNTYEERLAYAATSRDTFILHNFIVWLQDVLFAISQQGSVARRAIVGVSLVVFLAGAAGVAVYGTIGLTSLTASTWTLPMIFPLLALIAGIVFFLYSLKYYFSIALVLSYSRYSEDGEAAKKKSLLERIFQESDTKTYTTRGEAKGLLQNLSKIRLQRHPFVSIHLAMYNEKRVVDRLLTAATSMDYDNYEVIVADDSTDPEAIAILAKWENHPRVKILHRTSRDGYKGQALQNALKHTNKRAEFIMIFDADFIPYPDSIQQFLKYFQVTVGSLHPKEIQKNAVAAVQGYQWHVLNKSENWITRGVRSEYAGSYVVERSSIEIYGGLKQISGSVYMVRKDVVEKIGWGRSITEDFEFTLRLYTAGFKVAYTPYVQAPAEAASTLQRLIRQRMRWAEGHSFNVKKMCGKILRSTRMTLAEKLEFIYLSPYYLQAAVFLFGTFFWFLSEAVFRVELPFWTAVWGWSLILTNIFALPLMNLVGLFLEESDEKDYLGLLSFVGLSYIVAPFQGYAAVKGFIEHKEGPWFRTPKTGRITDSFAPGKFYRYVKGFFGKLAPAVDTEVAAGVNPYVALATANNSFDRFTIVRRKSRWAGKVALVALLLFGLTLLNYTRGVPEVMAANPSGTFVLSHTASTQLTSSSTWQLLDNTTSSTNSTTTVSINSHNTTPAWYQYQGGGTNSVAIAGTACPTAAATFGWIFDTPFGGSGGSIATGPWSFYYNLTDNQSGYVGNLEYCVYAVTLSSGSIGSSRLLYDSSTDATPPSTDVWVGGTSNSSYTSSSIAQSTMTFNANEYLYVTYYNKWTTTVGGKSASYTSTMNIGGSTVATSMRIVTPAVTIPEDSIFIFSLALVAPLVIAWLRRRKEAVA